MLSAGLLIVVSVILFLQVAVPPWHDPTRSPIIMKNQLQFSRLFSLSLLVVTVIVVVVTVIHFCYIYLRAVLCGRRLVVMYIGRLFIESTLSSFFSLVRNKVTDSHQSSWSRVEGLYKSF